MSPGFWSPTLYLSMPPIVALDAALPVLPSEMLVVVSGSLSADGGASLVTVTLLAALGSWLGDMGLYLLFVHRLVPRLERFRWGRALHRSLLRIACAAGTTSTYATLVTGRFIPGGRTATVAAAGLAGVAQRPFLAATAVGSLLWAGYLVTLGYFTGTLSGLPVWLSALMGVGIGIVAGLLLSAVVGIRSRYRSKGAGPHPAAPSAPAAGHVHIDEPDRTGEPVRSALP